MISLLSSNNNNNYYLNKLKLYCYNWQILWSNTGDFAINHKKYINSKIVLGKQLLLNENMTYFSCNNNNITDNLFNFMLQKQSMNHPIFCDNSYWRIITCNNNTTNNNNGVVICNSLDSNQCNNVIN